MNPRQKSVKFASKAKRDCCANFDDGFRRWTDLQPTADDLDLVCLVNQRLAGQGHLCNRF